MKCLQIAKAESTKEELVVVETNSVFSLLYLSSLFLSLFFAPFSSFNALLYLYSFECVSSAS